MDQLSEQHATDGNANMTTDARQELGALLDRHRKIAFKVANTYASNLDARAELAQEIAAQLWRAFRAYDPQTRVFHLDVPHRVERGDLASAQRTAPTPGRVPRRCAA